MDTERDSSPEMDTEHEMSPEMDEDPLRRALTHPDRNEFPAEFVFRLHRNNAREAATGFLGFIIIRTPNFHKLIERGFILEEEYILAERSRIYVDGDFVPDKWDQRAKAAHPSFVCRRLWPIRHLAYWYSGEIRLYSDNEDRLAVIDIFSGNHIWAWAAVAEINGYFSKDEGGKIYNYVADWVRQPFDGRERRNWCLIPELTMKPDDRWWCWKFDGKNFQGV
ncbi:hypothetical protein QBC40DRAFT_317292 [Triangularia verruculosa]|uniref:Uncharacterized protein n=1 Tax=Triangularia verruculosa TaxID=2587418 RepID=A0AAN6XMQ5_9PEZI|nr:hypothetical protein QBC40DRAFT_317292 [Triangularia verruculosa]